MGSIIKNFLSLDSVFYRLRTFNVYRLVVVILKLLANASGENFCLWKFRIKLIYRMKEIFHRRIKIIMLALKMGGVV